MIIYLNDERFKIIINDVVYRFGSLLEAPTTNDIKLLSSNGDILKDSNGLYIIVKDGENNGQ